MVKLRSVVALGEGGLCNKGWCSLKRFEGVESWKVMIQVGWLDVVCPLMTNWRTCVYPFFRHRDSCAEPSLEKRWRVTYYLPFLFNYSAPIQPHCHFGTPKIFGPSRTKIEPTMGSFWYPNLGWTNRRVEKDAPWKVLSTADLLVALSSILGTQSCITSIPFLTICFFQFFDNFRDFWSFYIFTN